MCVKGHLRTVANPFTGPTVTIINDGIIASSIDHPQQPDPMSPRSIISYDVSTGFLQEK